MQDIADHVGVSRQLVSLVMRDVPGPSAESRERILAAASELGYRPNASARLLRQNRTRLIGAVFEIRHPFQVRFVERLFVRAAEEGFGLALGPRTVERSTDVVVAELMEQRVEALVAFNPDPRRALWRAAASRRPRRGRSATPSGPGSKARSSKPSGQAESAAPAIEDCPKPDSRIC